MCICLYTQESVPMCMEDKYTYIYTFCSYGQFTTGCILKKVIVFFFFN
uniref:Alternative protein GABRB3 n=1 Tax=Homo sapiens TaxID=9606 RepID=L8E9G0_HUMAN|nr:alternative protein GABRB3 [Homo sapiens]